MGYSTTRRYGRRFIGRVFRRSRRRRYSKNYSQKIMGMKKSNLLTIVVLGVFAWIFKDKIKGFISSMKGGTK